MNPVPAGLLEPGPAGHFFESSLRMKQIFSSLAARLLALTLAAAMAGCGSGGGSSTAASAAGAANPPPVATSPAATGGGTAVTPPADAGATAGAMRDLTSMQLSTMMSPGINLGNTLEAIPSETAWGEPLTTQTIMDAYKAAGFKTVRIPVAWSQYADASFTISASWMARVTQVVQMAHKAGLIAIVNIHWDGGWMNHPTYDQQAAINSRLTKFWTQIANNFKDYDDTLLFAGSNEVGQDNTYGPPTAEYAAVQNSFNQTFVDAVRATGGNNATRHLVVQGYFTNIDHTVATNTVPTDTVANRLFMEVHYYDPYDFTLNADSAIWQWGATATDPAATETWANEPWADTEFQKMKTRFGDQGVPVLVGEYGAYAKAKYPGMDAYAKKWVAYVTHSMVQHGLVPVYWDTGGLFDRSTGAQKDPETISLIVNSSK